MSAFDEAWGVLKALEEQQGFTMSPFTPTVYGQENPPMQQRAGTIHPPILGLMERTQRKPYKFDATQELIDVKGRPFPDRRIADGDLAPRGTMVSQEVPVGDMRRMYAERMNPMTGQLSDDELTDAAQRKRGSLFDAGHYNKHGLPMVGVRQPSYHMKNQYVQDILDLFRSGYYNS